MRSYLTLFVLVALGTACLAGEIRKGAAMQVRANSIWFQDAALLTRWQKLKNGSDAKAFAAYQEKALGHRDAWQFVYPQAVKILGFERKTNQVHVQMTGEGRLQDSEWFVDAEALEK